MYNGLEEIQNDKQSLIFSESYENTISENTQEIQGIWQKALSLLSKKLKTGAFNTWIQSCTLLELKTDHALIGVKNEFSRNFISQTYIKDIELALREITASRLGIRLCIDENIENVNKLDSQEETPNFPQQASLASINETSLKTKLQLDSNKTFASFITGKSNRLSLLFAKAFLEGSSNKYKSLFIYSEPGLGKTHLLNAIAQQALEDQPKLKIKLIKAESFMNEFISSINKKNTAAFRENFRKLDMLIVDDVQFLQGKKASQEELMHTFDAISQYGGKLVFSAASNPKELNGLDPNLKSRLEGSLMTEIMPLDQECLSEILEAKAIEHGLQLEKEHLNYLQNQKINNIRDIESILLKLSTLNSHIDIDNEHIAKLFNPIQYSSKNYRGLNIENIVQITAAYFGKSTKDLLSSKRHKEFTKARHLAIYLAKELLDISFARIGEYFSGRKHSSIIYSVNLMTKELEQDRSLQLVVEDIKTRLAN